MFRLLVFYPGETAPQRTETLVSASEVLLETKRLLEEHAGCERVEVMMGDDRLFAVDCAGNRIP